MNTSSIQFQKAIYIWLWIGLVMVFVQVVVGGITRLTDSGLSITDWAVIQGVLPPTGQQEWLEAFDLYKEHASKQFVALHGDMTLSEFKWIYFWEYIHRLWARFMGLVFLIPLLFFVFKGWVDKALGKRLLFIFSLAALAGLFGWIMVASGLNDDQRTWVSAYKLITHLGIAVSLFFALCWIIMWYSRDRRPVTWTVINKSWVLLLFIQILLGGLMAGMRAGLIFPYYPLIGDWGKVNEALSQGVTMSDLSNYEPAVTVKAWVQLLHRGFALILLIVALWIYIKNRNKLFLNVLLILVVQYILGLLTVIKSVGGIPVSWGAVHQAIALVLIYVTVRWMWDNNKIAG